MKRILQTLLISVLCLIFGLGALTGCDREPSAPTPTDLKLSGLKTEFANGEEFSSEGMVVTVVYSDQTEKNISASDYTVDSSAYKKDEAGSYEIKVKYRELTKSYTVKVSAAPDEEAIPTELSLSGMKTEFEYGEEFSSEGLTVVIVYSDGTTKTASEFDLDFSAYREKEAGEYEIVVVCGKLSKSYQVTVKEQPEAEGWEEDGVLRILLIGNSFSEDTFEYIWEIADSLDIEAEVGLCWIPGQLLNAHYTNLLNNNALYEYRLKTTANQGRMESKLNRTMGSVIADKDWDFVSIQVGGGDCRESQFLSFDNVLSMIRNHFQNEHTVMCAFMVWAFPYDSPDYTIKEYFGGDQMRQYTETMKVLRKCVVSKGLKVIPSGTAIQNARSSYLGDTLCRDEYHLTYGLGRYISSMTYFAAATGNKIPENVYAPSGTYAFTAEEKTIALESVANAIANPFEVTPSKYTAR